MNKLYIYAIQVLFVGGIAVGSQTLDQQKWLIVARYIIYLLTIKCIPHLCQLIHVYQATGHLDLQKTALNTKDYALVYLAAVAYLVFWRCSLFREDFVYVGLAYIAVKYPEMVRRSLVAIVSWSSNPSINYGVGMACSFFEGYLIHIIPSDGAKFVGFEENIRALEDKQGVLFPVKKLFIIITKNLYCPPDLKEFNRTDGDGPYLEAFNALKDVEKSVAGVKNRIYRNTAYKVYRPRAPPVCLTAECATPLHTLYQVINNRTLYQEVADIDVSAVVSDFCRTLQSIIDKSPRCRGKCELIYYDNEDPKQNLAEILLSRIRELAPDFEDKIVARKQENVVEEQ